VNGWTIDGLIVARRRTVRRQGRSEHMAAPDYPPQRPDQQHGQPQPNGSQPQYDGQPAYPGQGYPPPEYTGQPMPGVPASAGYARPQGPIGQIRSTGLTMLLFFVTLGIWGFVYYYQTQEEMKRHSGEGLGGALALVIAIIFGLVSPFILSHEVGQLYERRGEEKRVSAITGLWFFPGMFIVVGPFIWFIQTNRELNAYWESLGARRP
jgi:hypothetical protein